MQNFLGFSNSCFVSGKAWCLLNLVTLSLGLVRNLWLVLSRCQRASIRDWYLHVIWLLSPYLLASPMFLSLSASHLPIAHCDQDKSLRRLLYNRQHVTQKLFAQQTFFSQRKKWNLLCQNIYFHCILSYCLLHMFLLHFMGIQRN